MAIQEKLYTVDDVCGLAQQPENELKHYYLIDGELFWEMPPGYQHGHIAGLIFHYFLIFAERHDLGKPPSKLATFPPMTAKRCSRPMSHSSARRMSRHRITRDLSRACPIWRWRSNPPAIRWLNCAAKPRCTWRMAQVWFGSSCRSGLALRSGARDPMASQRASLSRVPAA